MNTKQKKVYCEDCKYHRYMGDCTRCTNRDMFADTGEGCGNLQCQRFDVCLKHPEEYVEENSIRKVVPKRYKLCADFNHSNECEDFEPRQKGFLSKLFMSKNL